MVKYAISSAILDRVLPHCTVMNIKGEGYHLKERKKIYEVKITLCQYFFANIFEL